MKGPNASTWQTNVQWRFDESHPAGVACYAITTTVLVGRALLEVARNGSADRILEIPAINELGRRTAKA